MHRRLLLAAALLCGSACDPAVGGGSGTRSVVSNGGTFSVELTTAPSDMGKIIGRQGRTAAALRTLVSLTAEQHGSRAQLDIRD